MPALTHAVHIQRLRLQHFRNIAALDEELHPVINVVHGRNAQGKTNLLEAVFLLATLKSFRAARTAELLAWDQPEAAVAATLMRHQVKRTVSMRIRPGAKVVHVDGKRAGSLLDTFGHVHAVLFAPEDLAISKGSAGMRRTFLDRAIFNVVPVYYEETREYDKALRSRNALLRDASGRVPDAAMMAVFDAQLARLGARITYRRASFVDSFRDRVVSTHGGLCAHGHTVDLQYDSGGRALAGYTEADIAEAFAAQLGAERRRDIARGSTSSGPHADDLAIALDGRPARLHASQGQHRTIVLALKLAELDHIEAALGVRPVLLLDDVSSELDRERNAQLLEHLDHSRGQVIVTTTDPAYLAHRGEAAHFRVDAGRVAREEFAR